MSIATATPLEPACARPNTLLSAIACELAAIHGGDAVEHAFGARRLLREALRAVEHPHTSRALPEPALW